MLTTTTRPGSGGDSGPIRTPVRLRTGPGDNLESSGAARWQAISYTEQVPDHDPASCPIDDQTPTSPATAPGFTELGLDPRLLDGLAELGFDTPTPIQYATFPELMAGRDVIGLAQTGTGKTAAFGLPMLSRIADQPSHAPLGLVLTPTRELALQVHDALTEFAAPLPGIRILAVYGGAPYTSQLNRLRRGVQIVVGTPGRIIDHLERGNLDLSALRHLVLDEADEMLAMGFAEEVERILSETPTNKQVALFSATMPQSIRALAASYLRQPREISVQATTKTNATTSQRFLTVAHTRKVEALARILEVEQTDGVIIFVKTRVGTEELAAQLGARGFQAAPINGDMPQSLRERTISLLRESTVNIVVATDVAARGLDVERISHVINFDIAHDGEAYIHRIGRTGRAGRSGQAITFITPKQRRLLASIEKSTRQPMTPMQIPSVSDINASRIARFRQAISQALDSAQLDQFRTLIESYLNEHDDLTPTQVAAALAVLAQDGQPLLLDPEPERPRRGPVGGTAFNTYRLAIGHQQRIKPGQIIAALANEGGLSGESFGRIDIRDDHTLVELTGLDADALTDLAAIRIRGRRLDLTPSEERASDRAQRAKAGRRPRSRREWGDHKPGRRKVEDRRGRRNDRRGFSPDRSFRNDGPPAGYRERPEQATDHRTRRGEGWTGTTPSRWAGRHETSPRRANDYPGRSGSAQASPTPSRETKGRSGTRPDQHREAGGERKPRHRQLRKRGW